MVILLLNSFSKRSSGNVWNLLVWCLHAVPWCLTVIRSPKDSLFCWVPGYLQLGHLCPSIHEIFSCRACGSCFWKASCLDIKLPEHVLWSFSLCYYFNLCPLILWIYLHFFCQPFCSGFVLFGNPPASASWAFLTGMHHHIQLSSYFEKPFWVCSSAGRVFAQHHAQSPGFNP